MPACPLARGTQLYASSGRAPSKRLEHACRYADDSSWAKIGERCAALIPLRRPEEIQKPKHDQRRPNDRVVAHAMQGLVWMASPVKDESHSRYGKSSIAIW
ncbi:protein of unknown function (plasmid) [Cupriavidus taiwanensis]|uniref:Uncharacterized protein n=1 Tax=Cupriavidus taiwanensis TaxID=164546 RepID=A0A976AAI2_9BURK|nr:hypothetical protein CBM2587_P10050 [Cupriavidus taiwanensis]SPD38002.1 protein of unknown function [Cupriavidus taiwanensis]